MPKGKVSRGNVSRGIQQPVRARLRRACSVRRVHLTLPVFLLTSVVCFTGCKPAVRPPKPAAELTQTEAQGQHVFSAHCAQCHYADTDEKLHGPSLKAVFQKPYLPSGAPANDERVTATIQHGRNMMPAQPDLDPAETADLLAYLHTL